MSLDDYPLDDDYIDVDNDDPPSDVAKEQYDPDGASDESLATEHGDGASSQLDDIIDETAVQSNDGRSVTRTMFYGHDVDSNGPPQKHRSSGDKTSWDKLAKWNDGMWDSSRSGRNKKADNDRWIDGFCSVLDCSDYVQERVEYIIGGINLRHMATYSAQQTILATIELVEAEERISRGGNPLTQDDTFHDLVDKVGSSVEEMRKVRRLVREKSDQFDYQG